jgi:membrane-bound lytic murein transglycosylase D
MASGTPNILLPWDNAVIFQDKLTTHTGALASWTAWVVPSTMTVAQAATRVGMSESELREVNNIPPRMSLRAGSSLLVPRTGQRNSDVPLHVADNAQLNLQPDVVLRRSVVKARKGDTLARLAQRYGVSAVSVAGWNKLAVNAALKPGQQVTLMLPKRVSLASGGSSAKKQATTSANTRKVAKSASKPTKAKVTAVAKKKTTKSASSSSAKTRVASTAKAEKRP